MSTNNIPSSHSPTSVSWYAWALFVLMCFVYMLTPFHRVSPALMATDIMSTLQLNAADMGLLASVFFVSYGIMQIPSGLLTDGVGPRRLLPIMVALSALGTAIFGMAESFTMALLGRGLIGIGASVVFLCAMKIIGQWFPMSLFARLGGILLGVGGIGMLVAATPLTVASDILGWRVAFYGIAGIALFFAVLLFFGVKDAAAEKAKAGHVDWQLMRSNFSTVIKHRDFWFVCLWSFCQFNMHMSFGGLWGGTYLRDVLGLNPGDAGHVLDMAAIGVIVGGFSIGYICDKIIKSIRKTMLFASIIYMLNFACLAIFSDSIPVWCMYIWFFLLSALGVPAMSVAFTAMRRIFGVHATGSASGLLNSFPSMGMLIFQPLTGFILDVYPKSDSGGFLPVAYESMCWFYVGAAVLGFMGAFFMHEKHAESE